MVMFLAASQRVYHNRNISKVLSVLHPKPHETMGSVVLIDN